MATDSRPPGRLLAVAVLGAAVGVAGVWTPVWSRDEAATVMVVRRPLPQVWRTFEHDPALAPYYLVVDGWALVATSELWLRLLSVSALVGAAVLLVRVADRFVGPTAATAAGLVLVLLPASTRFGQDARPYALSMLLATAVVAIWLGDRSLERRRRQLAVIAGLVAVGLMHAYALLIVPVLLAVAALRPERDRRREVLAVTGCGAVAGLVLSPYLWVVATGAEGAPNRPDLTPVNLATEIARLPVGILGPPGAPVTAAVVLGLAVAGIGLGARAGGRARAGAVLASTWLVLPPLVLCLMQASIGAPGLLARYWTFCLPALGLAIALVVDRVQRRPVVAAVVVVGVVGLLGLPTQVALRGPDGHAGRGWRELPPVLRDSLLSDAALLVRGPHYRALVVSEPSLGERMPLVLDPAPSGRIHPQIAGRESPELHRLATRHDLVVVLQNLPRPVATAPDAGDFVDHRRELRTFARPVVLCSYFGYPLGVFATESAIVDTHTPARIAARLRAVDPLEVTCRVS